MGWPNSFRTQVASRALLIAASLLALCWSLLRTGWDAVPVVCGVLCVLLVAELVRYVEAGTRDLAALMESVAAGDFSTTAPVRSRQPPFADFHRASTLLVSTYRRLHLQRAASDEMLRAAVDHVGVAVVSLGADGRIAFANPEARRHLPLTNDAFRLRLLALHDDERTQLELPSPGNPAVLLLLHARRFGLLDEQFIVVVAHDIRQELESRDVQAWQSLVRVLSHEMLNSLTPIVTLSGHLREELRRQPVRDSDTVESIEVIHERSGGLARFIEAYRQFAHPPAPLPASVDAAALVEGVARLKRAELGQLGIRLDVAIEDAVMQVHVDARQIEQVLLNLLRNAEQSLAQQGGGRIELRVARDPAQRVLIHVIDDGPGIAPDVLERIFVPFFSTRANGTGVGLALSRQLMQLNRGNISADGRVGRCCFTLQLPEAEPA